MKTELFGCPICGKLPAIETGRTTMDRIAWVHCMEAETMPAEEKHTVEVCGFTTADAIARWNALPRTRPKP